MAEKKGSNKGKIFGGIIVVLAILAIAAYFIVPKIMADNEPSSDKAAPSIAATSAAAADFDLNGNWNIDKSDSFAGYRVTNHMGQEDIEVVGRTSDVSGEVVIDGDKLTTATITVNLTTVSTDSDQRDEHMREEYLETAEYPTATFTATEDVDLSGLNDGAITVDVPGELNIHGVTKPATLQLQATAQGETIIVTGTSDITWGDFNVETPSSAMADVEDSGSLEYQLTLTK